MQQKLKSTIDEKFSKSFEKFIKAREVLEKNNKQRGTSSFACNEEIIEEASWTLRLYAQSVIDYYRQWNSYENLHQSNDRIEIYAPSLLQIFSRNKKQSIEDTLELWKREILHLCLFVDKLWLPDPSELLAQYIVNGAYNVERITLHSGWQDTFNSLSILDSSFSQNIYLSDNISYQILKSFEELEPLIKSEIISLYPPIINYRKYVLSDLSEHLNNLPIGADFLEKELTGVGSDLFVAEGLLTSNVLNASYSALYKEEFHAIKEALKYFSLDSHKELGGSDPTLVAVLPKLKLPFFDRLNTKILIKVRQDEEAFNDFRAILREFSTQFGRGLDDPKLDKTVDYYEKAYLEPKIKSLLKSTSRWKALRENLSERGIEFSAATLASFFFESTLSYLLPIGSGAVALAILKMIQKEIDLQKNTRPAAKVIYGFHSGKFKLPKSSFHKIYRGLRY